MKVIDHTPDRLTVEDKPWLLGIIIGAAILIFVLFALLTVGENGWLGLGFGLGAALFGVAFVAFVRRVIVIFDRGAGAVVIRTASLLGQSEQTLALADITGATVETTRSTSSSNNGRRSSTLVHRPVLQTASGPVPLTQVFSGGTGAETVADAINRWLTGFE